MTIFFSHLHSFIIDISPKSKCMNIFDLDDWEYISTIKTEPAVPEFVIDIICGYYCKSLKKLREKAMKPYLNADEEYDPKKHFIHEHIQMAIRTICSLWENPSNPLARRQYEHWYTVNLFGIVFDFCFRDPVLQTDVKRQVKCGS